MRDPRGALKRVFDVLAVLALLPLLMLPMLAIGALVRRGLGRPIIFRQRRTGRNGAMFTLYKFRTMLDRTDDQGVQLPDAARLTVLGSWLRSTSLDELPQILNVLRGDMSLVGPRPLLPEYLGHYTERQRRRHEVRPGLTGLAQVSGRNALSWKERLELDVRYVEDWSLSLDLRILIRTVGQVISRRGVRARGHATTPRFHGTDRVDA